jgi:hypothetical protein
MTVSEADFRKWFVESLAPLRKNGDAGFIFVFGAFPLLERYLRRKSGCPDGQNLTPAFFANLGLLFPDIAGNEHQFWDCYRNGLLHQATFPAAKLDKKTGIWVTLPEAGISGHDPRPVYFLPVANQFFLNPISFFDAVTIAILADFAVYEGGSTNHYNLPSVLDPFGAVPHVVPTINPRLPGTGSFTP